MDYLLFIIILQVNLMVVRPTIPNNENLDELGEIFNLNQLPPNEEFIDYESDMDIYFKDLDKTPKAVSTNIN